MRQLTILGTGLIGGSLALALKKCGFRGSIVGCDRKEILDRAQAAGIVELGIADPIQACQGSDVVVLATPVGAIIDLIERLGPVLPPGTLLTDVGSTKAEIVARARAVFGELAGERFLPGHPMAGKEFSGVEHADADLFRGAVWLVTPIVPAARELPAAARDFLQWIERIGARVIEIDAERHDRLCAWISHLPQMLSTALASTLQDELGEDANVDAIGGRALREMTRLAQSPYSMWRDIALTNTANLRDALLALEQRLAHLRENLRTREMEAEFERARQFRAKD
ncbi:MAG: prephenate dehydrogenase [Terriglobales bacterium]